jgi:hypothetical protein
LSQALTETIPSQPRWAEDMIALLCKANTLTTDARLHGMEALPAAEVEHLHRRYDAILEAAAHRIPRVTVSGTFACSRAAGVTMEPSRACGEKSRRGAGEAAQDVLRLGGTEAQGRGAIEHLVVLAADKRPVDGPGEDRLGVGVVAGPPGIGGDGASGSRWP